MIVTTAQLYKVAYGKFAVGAGLSGPVARTVEAMPPPAAAICSWIFAWRSDSISDRWSTLESIWSTAAGVPAA